MEIRTLYAKEEMLNNFQLLLEVYPQLELEAYAYELDQMLPHNYGQTCVYKDGICVALTGFWFDYMKNFAELEGCTMLALDSYTDNFRAHKFFYKKGYIPRGFRFIQVLKPERVR